MTSAIQIAPDLKLPLDVASQTIALVGIRGAGKTNTAGVIAEELLDRNQPIVVIDPTDAWWGLRSGYPVFILGGAHGDIPLSETDGKVIAEFIVNERVPAVLSLRHLRKNAARRFVMEFCEELYHLKGKDANRSPLTVFIDEAPLFVPQKVMGETARVVGAVEDLIARGRNAGFGVVLISQRSATINKDVLTQADTIIAHRLTSPQDRKALAEWIEENATIAQQKDVLASLATLANGDAWVWAPVLGIVQRVHIRLRHTFDSSATPKRGERLAPPKKLTEIDLNKLKGQLAQAVEKAKADDPRELKAVILDLKKQFADRGNELERVAKECKVKVTEVPVLKDAQLKTAGDLVQRLADITQKLTGSVAEIGDAMRQIVQHQKQRPAENSTRPASRTTRYAPAAHGYRLDFVPHTDKTTLGEALTAHRRAPRTDDLSLGKAERAILTVLSQHGPSAKGKLALLAGYAYSGGFRNSLSLLRTNGYIVGGNEETMRITDDGVRALGPYDPLPTGARLIDYWSTKFGKCESAIIAALERAGRDGLGAEELARATHYEFSGGFRNSLSALRTAGVIVGKNTETMRLADEMLI